jgi:pimeloyl-ACP methyl ester carboxylesterase
MSASRRLGSGPPLVLVNGYAATAADWDPTFIEALAAGRELICVDNPGVGQARADPPPHSIEDAAETLARQLEELGLGSVAVLGWSLGGMVAQALAAAAPERVSALVLLSTDAGGPEAEEGSARAWQQLTSREGTPREQASRLIGLLFPPDFARIVDERFGDVVAAARAELPAATLEAQEAAMAAWHAEPAGERLAAIRAPVLVAAGTEDVVIPSGNAGLIARALPGAWLAHFPGGGHAFMAQEPRRLAALILAFLR